ncbi:MAG: radical SAM protein, partial [Halobacteriota archaeon]|nr:radical SAM protein [Halobacteriota archaeon]
MSLEVKTIQKNEDGSDKLGNYFYRLIKKFLPGGLRGNAELVGLKETFKLVFGTALGYRRTILWFLRNRKFSALFNFFYVKALVPVGEGAGAGLYFIIGPIIRKFPNLAPYPRYVEIEMTTICNKKCVLCEHTYWKDQEEKHLSFDEFEHIINEFPKLKWVNLTGEGDAFLNPDYLEMIRYLKSKNVPVFLVDSFDLIDNETAKELVKMGVDGIYVSMDGATSATYNRIKAGCDFDRSIDHIKNLIELKKEYKSPIPELCFRYVITTLNVDETPKFIDVISSLGNKKELGDGSRVEFCGLLEFDQIKRFKVPKVPERIFQATIEKAKEQNV